MRLRAQELQFAIGGEQLNHYAGLPQGYIAKLLAPRAPRRIGMISLGPLLGALGVELVIVENPCAVERINGRIAKVKPMPSAAVHFALSRRFLKKIGAKGGANSRASFSKRKRRKLARDAALIRWADVKAATRPKPNGRSGQ